MTTPNQHNPDNTPPNAGEEPAMPLDLLIGRIVDGEASLAQRQRFEALAAADADLWRMLALKQQDMSMLAVHIEPHLNAAERIDVPPHARIGKSGEADGEGLLFSSAAPSRHLRSPWWLAISGWAAVIVIAAVWSISEQWRQANQHGVIGVPVANQPRSLTPDQHLDEYKRAPFVHGEMDPVLLNVDSLPDGRLAVSYLRRIVEVAMFAAADQVPLDEEGRLTEDPAALRDHAPAPQQPHD